MTDPKPAPNSAARVLIRGVNWLGDAVMTTPALQRLREALPAAHLTLLTPEKLGDLWQHHPGLNAVETFSPGESLWSVAGRLRAGHYEAALVFPNSPRSALEVFLARIPQRIGARRAGRRWLLTRAVAPRQGQRRMAKRSAREIRRLLDGAAGNTATTAAVPPRGLVHQIYDYLHLVTALGASAEPVPPMLSVPDAEVRDAEVKFLSKHQTNAGSSAAPTSPVLLGLNPGAEYGPAKRWPAENFAAVVRAVSRDPGNCLWLAFGGPGDRQVCEQVVTLAGGGVLNLAGRTSLRQLMALLKLCRVVLTNDSGPMHVAAALGTPVVVPFGSTSPELSGPALPGDPRHRLLKSTAPCSPCFRRVCPIDFRCMTSITPAAVAAGIRELL